MAYEEYRDLFIKAQKNPDAPYKCFSFDFKNSTTLNNYEVRELTFNTINTLTQKLLKLEKEQSRKILLIDSNIKIAKIIPNDMYKNNMIYHSNPCFTSGDSFHYYTYNNSITEEEFISLFKESLLENSNHFIYHFASGKFETTNSGERNKKYYVGYIICELTYNKTNRMCDISLEQENTF